MKGHTKDGKPLNEDTLKASRVRWRGKIYTTGNRRHDQVELWSGGMFVRIASMKHIEIP